MIRHVVLLKVREDVDEDGRRAVFEALAGLRQVIAGIEAFHHGPYTSPEGLNRGYTHAFTMDFADAAARDAYLPHPRHVEVAAQVAAILEGGVEGALAFDFEL